MNRFRSVRTLVTTLAVVIASTSLLVWLPRNSSAYTPHAPIYIDGDAAFTAANGVTAGTGTPSDPFIIEYWDINATLNWQAGITIANTNAHFIIRYVAVHDGVWTHNVTTVERDAIDIYNAANGRVEGTSTWNNWHSIVVAASYNITVTMNTPNGDLGHAVWVWHSSYISVLRNTPLSWVQGLSPAAGVMVTASSNVTVMDNQYLHGHYGIAVHSSTNVTIRGNRLVSSRDYGVLVVNSTGVRVHNNQFIDNAVQAFDDRGSENSWDAGCSGGGNYWSDYNGSDRRDCSTGAVGVDGFGDAPRIIDADSQDNYPLVSSSMVDGIRPYWHNSSPVIVNASVRPNYPGIRDVALWYRNSADNATWSNWTLFQSLNLPPWSLSFYFPGGEGYYEFYTIATTFLGKAEPPPASAQAIAGYDATPPASSAIPISPYWHTAPPLLVDATASDSLSGVGNVTLLYSFSSDNNVTWSAWTPFGTDGAPPWSWSFPFPDGQGHYRFHTIARDVAGNAEPSKSAMEAMAGYFVPTEPPTTSLLIGWPNYTSTATYVKSSTPLDFSVVDRSGLGMRNTTYRIDDGAPVNYTATGTFFLAGEGEHTVEWRSLDWTGNLEDVSSKVLTVDDTPPATTISPADAEATTDTVFNLIATDSGCGVNITMYRIDGGSSTDYAGGFTLEAGEHDIFYYSKDNLDNTEVERTLHVIVQGAPPPPPPVEVRVNYKPIIALIFAIILLVAGAWSSRKRPWRGGKGRMAVAKAFMLISLPFVFAEAGTGIVSFFTGQLSIPPLIGVGTAVDLAILMAGILVAVLGALKPETPCAEEGESPRSR